MREVISILPTLEDNFTQRKNFDEFHFDECNVELDINIINSLTKFNFIITISEFEITLIM